MARSERHGLSCPGRAPMNFPGCAARAVLAATLERVLTERWCTGWNDAGRQVLLRPHLLCAFPVIAGYCLVVSLRLLRPVASRPYPLRSAHMFPPSFNAAQPEITDLIVEHDPATLERLAVDKKRVLDTFLAFRNREAMAAVRAIPDRGGFLDARAVDRVMLAVHWEMQRLAEEFFYGQRVYELLKVVLAAIAAMGIKHPLRVVDVG